MQLVFFISKQGSKKFISRENKLNMYYYINIYITTECLESVNEPSDA